MKTKINQHNSKNEEDLKQLLENRNTLTDYGAEFSANGGGAPPIHKNN